MPCWVVPTVAAELWGISLEQLNGQIRSGAVTAKVEHGFTLVDVAPDSERIAPAPRRRRPRARTFRPAGDATAPAAAAVANVAGVSEAELAALQGGTPQGGTQYEGRRRAAARAAGPCPTEVAEQPCDVAMRVAAAAAEIEPPLAQSAEDDAEMGPAGDPDPDRDAPYVDEGPPLHWQTVRARVGRMRKPPGK